MPSDFTLKTMNGLHRGLLKISVGRFGWAAGNMPVLELTTIGRKSGQPRSVMLTSPVQEGSTIVVVASRGGDDTHPAWFLNLRDNPDVEVAFKGAPKQKMRARVATADERARLWPLVTADHKNYAAYQTKTTARDPARPARARAEFVARSRVGYLGQGAGTPSERELEHAPPAVARDLQRRELTVGVVAGVGRFGVAERVEHARARERGDRVLEPGVGRGGDRVRGVDAAPAVAAAGLHVHEALGPQRDHAVGVRAAAALVELLEDVARVVAAVRDRVREREPAADAELRAVVGRDRVRRLERVDRAVDVAELEPGEPDRGRQVGRAELVRVGELDRRPARCAASAALPRWSCTDASTSVGNWLHALVGHRARDLVVVRERGRVLVVVAELGVGPDHRRRSTSPRPNGRRSPGTARSRRCRARRTRGCARSTARRCASSTSIIPTAQRLPVSRPSIEMCSAIAAASSRRPWL